MLDDPLKATEWAKLIIELGMLVLPQASKFVGFKKDLKLGRDPFLIYDADFLVAHYKAERPIAPGIPYAELADLLGESLDSIQISVIRGEFGLQPGDEAWASIAKAGYQALLESGRIRANEPMIHLRSVRRDSTKLALKIQKAAYHDQAKSNLILDWPAHVRPRSVTLRELLSTKYGERLPQLGDRRLANTVGVACLLFYWDRGQLVPYLVRRVEKVAVHPGGIHCTASGAANWPETSEPSFANFFLRAMYQELDEEVGLKREDITDLRAVSLCREFLRGGKPQIFFAGFTHLSRNQLKARRLKAADTIKKIAGWTEVERDTWRQSSDVVIPPGRLDDSIRDLGVALEGLGGYFCGRRYIDKYGRDILR